MRTVVRLLRPQCRPGRPTVLLVLSLSSLTACPRVEEQNPEPPAAPVNEPSLEFKRNGATVITRSRSALSARIPPVTLEVHDPYYERQKRYRALPLRAVLEAGFTDLGAKLENAEWILRAQDGYAVIMSGSQILEEGAYLALEDLDVPGWEPIGPQRANPGPFYLIWSKPEQQDVKKHPRPWQLASIELNTQSTSYPHTVPTGADEAAQRGYALFKAQCQRCHMVNREGGAVGPELNVPMSVVEYRDREYLRSFIRNPWRYRYGAMPPMPLTDQELDDVLAYFEAMRDRKHDPEAGKWKVEP